MTLNSIIKEAAKRAGSYNPFAIAKELGIDIQYTDKLPSDQSGLAVPDLNVIFLDSYHKDGRFKYFLCSHELKHIIEDSGIQGYYNISNKTKSQLEYEANQEAIKILIPYYDMENNIDRNTTYQHIMSMYDIPEDLDFMVEKELKKWYIKKTFC